MSLKRKKYDVFSDHDEDDYEPVIKKKTRPEPRPIVQPVKKDPKCPKCGTRTLNLSLVRQAYFCYGGCGLDYKEDEVIHGS